MLFSLTSTLLSLFTLAVATGPHSMHSRQIFGDPGQDAYLSAHNTLRSSHGAAPLTWSEDLAAMARGWAGDCQFRATEGVFKGEGRGDYGENIAGGTGFFSAGAFVDVVAAEAANYDASNPTFSGFTQAVWKNTTELGCANNRCVNLFPERNGLATIHVCFYNPAGNVNGFAAENVQV